MRVDNIHRIGATGIAEAMQNDLPQEHTRVEKTPKL